MPCPGTQQRCAGKQTTHGRIDTGGNNAAHKRACLVDDLDIGSSTEVDHNDGRTVQAFRSSSICHAVGAQFGELLLVHVDKVPHGLGGNDKQLNAERAIARLFPIMSKSGNHRGQNGTVDALGINAFGLHQNMQFNSELITGVIYVGSHTPHMNQVLTIVYTEHGLGISHVNRK